MSEPKKSQETPNEISEQDLDLVAGGNVSQLFQMMSNILKAQSDTNQAIVRNLRG